MFFKLWICVFLMGCLAQAQTRISLISDVDDTLKISEVLHPISAVWRLKDSKSYFIGMSELYQGILQKIPQTKISYVTAAPAFLVGETHLKILQNFPPGEYHPRSRWSSETHKLQTIRQILEEQKPQLVLFFGDNAEGDPLVYKKIEDEYAARGIQFITFIRINYSKYSRVEDSGDSNSRIAPPQKGQINFVTPVEVGIFLFQRQLLSSIAAQWINDILVPAIVREPSNLKNGVIAFPSFMDCRDFRWPLDQRKFNWSIEKLKEKIQRRCSARFAGAP